MQQDPQRQITFSWTCSRALSVLDWIATRVVIFAMAALVGLIAMQVLLRYGFGTSVMASDELARLCFVWAVFLAIPLGISANRHIVVEFFVARLSERLRSGVLRMSSFAAAIILAACCYQATRIALAQWDELMPTIDLSAGLFHVAVAIGTAHGALHLLAMAFGFSEQAPSTDLGEPS